MFLLLEMAMRLGIIIHLEENCPLKTSIISDYFISYKFFYVNVEFVSIKQREIIEYLNKRQWSIIILMKNFEHIAFFRTVSNMHFKDFI